MSTTSEDTNKGFTASAPMHFDRTAGWKHFTDPGAVYERDGQWFLTSYEAVRYAHQHPEIFSSARAFDSLGSPVPLIPIAIDQPDHVRYRRILDPFFAPRVVLRVEDSLREQAREIIAEFADKGETDIMQSLARLYPTQVIMTMFGLSLSDRDKFIDWTELIIGNSVDVTAGNNVEAQMEAGLALFTYLQNVITEKRANPADDVLSQILALSGEDAWTDEEVLGLCFLFVLAGLDTVTSVIGFILMNLAKRPDLRKAIAEDSEALGPIVEEVLRLELPAPMTPRVTLSDCEVLGVKIPAGSYCNLVIAAANRDGRPNEIDLEHADRGHLAFGGGIHRCLGSHLARRELRIALEEFHKMIPDYSIKEGTTPKVVWPCGTNHLDSLHLVFPKKESK